MNMSKPKTFISRFIELLVKTEVVIPASLLYKSEIPPENPCAFHSTRARNTSFFQNMQKVLSSSTTELAHCYFFQSFVGKAVVSVRLLTRLP